MDKSGGNLEGSGGLKRGGGRVGRGHRGWQDLTLKWFDGHPFHGLNMEHNVGTGALPLDVDWLEVLMIRME